jgi:aspartokinase
MKVSEGVRMYLKGKPYMLEAIDSGVVNYSALARLIQDKTGAKSYGAVKAAVIRHAAGLNAIKSSIEERALSVLKDNRIMLLDKVHVIVSSKKLSIENEAEVKIDFYHVYLTRGKETRALTKEERYGIVERHDGCSAIIIYSKSNIESTSGVVAFITSLLAEYNINIVELLSCYTETIIIINSSDALVSYKLLSDIMS